MAELAGSSLLEQVASLSKELRELRQATAVEAARVECVHAKAMNDAVEEHRKMMTARDFRATDVREMMCNKLISNHVQALDTKDKKLAALNVEVSKLRTALTEAEALVKALGGTELGQKMRREAELERVRAERDRLHEKVLELEKPDEAERVPVAAEAGKP